MKTKYKYIYFEKSIEPENYHCYGNETDKIFGWIEYKEEWRKFVYQTVYGMTASAEILDDISHFLKQLNRTKGCYKTK